MSGWGRKWAVYDGYVSKRMRVRQFLGFILVAIFACAQHHVALAEHWLNDPASSRITQDDAYRRIPFSKMTPQAAEKMRDVVDRPSFFRRMPTQTFECDQELFTFLVRYPEVLVNIWDIMDITKVSVKRISPFMFQGQDGAGTVCKCDLVYGHPDLHIYYGHGSYSGSMAPREITGRCVCVLYSKNANSVRGNNVTGSMDVYLKLDNLGADLLTRTLGPFVGKTADYNFVETAKFLGQIDDVCENNPDAAQQLASRLNKVEPSVREKFSQLATQIASSKSIEAGTSNYAQRQIDDKPSLGTENTRESPSVSTESGGSRVPLRAIDVDASRVIHTRNIAPQKPQIYMRR